MYCPHCGAGNQNTKAYCKTCGEWLPDFRARTRSTFGGETPQQQIFTSLFMSALSTVAALFSAIALYITGGAKWAVYVAAGVCLCIAGWQISSFFVTLRLRRRLKNSRDIAGAPVELNESKPAHVLNAGDFTTFVGVTSVTENSTDLLDHVRSAKRETQT
jgi:hypothetical protein